MKKKKLLKDKRQVAKWETRPGRLPEGKHKFTPTELEFYVQQFIKIANNPKNRVVASVAGFVN